MIDKSTIVSRTPGHMMSPVYAELVTTIPEQAKLEKRTKENSRRIREEA
jgi:hypothetical protein